MKILFITFTTLFTSYSAQALSCYSCPTGTTFNDCVTDHVIQKCSDDKKHCITIKTYVIKSSGEQVLYLEKDCGEAVACGQPDPGSLVCNMKNTSYTFKGHNMANCTARCCTADLCNSDDLPLLAIATSSRPSLSVIATVVPSSPQPGDAITTAKPTGCGTESISLPIHMTVALAAVVLLALFNFELM
ncbi:hypothetical protein ACROYT_G007859 [Oculina patagonica]